MISYTILEGSTRICNEFIYKRTEFNTSKIGGCNGNQYFTATNSTVQLEILSKFCEYTSWNTYIYKDNGPSYCITEDEEGNQGRELRCNYSSESNGIIADENNNITQLFTINKPICFPEKTPCSEFVLNTEVTFPSEDPPAQFKATTTIIKTKTIIPTSTTSMVQMSNFSFTFNGSRLVTLGASVKITTQGSRTVAYNSVGTTNQKIEGVPPFEPFDQATFRSFVAIGGYKGSGKNTTRTCKTVTERKTAYRDGIPNMSANQRFYYNTVVLLTNYFPHWYRDKKEIFEGWQNKTQFLRPVQKGVSGSMGTTTRFTVSYLEPLQWILGAKSLSCLAPGAVTIKQDTKLSVTTYFNYSPNLVSRAKTIKENVTITNESRNTTNLTFNGNTFNSYKISPVGGVTALSIEDKSSLLLKYSTFDPNSGAITRKIKQSYVSTLSQLQFNFAKFRIPYYKIQNQEIESLYLSNNYGTFYYSNCNTKSLTLNRGITHYISQEYNKIPVSPKFLNFFDLEYLRDAYLDISYYGRAMAPNSTSSYYTNVFLSNSSKGTTNFGGAGDISIFPNLTIPIKQLTPTFTEQLFGQTLNKTIDGSFLSKVNVSFTTTSKINSILTTITLGQGSSWKASGPLKLETAWTIDYLDNDLSFASIKNIRGVCSIGDTKTSITRVYFPGYFMSYDNNQINKVQLVKEILTVSSIMPGDGFLVPTVQHIVVDNIYDHNISSPRSFFQDTQLFLPEVIKVLNQDENLNGVITAFNACYNH